MYIDSCESCMQNIFTFEWAKLYNMQRTTKCVSRLILLWNSSSTNLFHDQASYLGELVLLCLLWKGLLGCYYGDHVDAVEWCAVWIVLAFLWQQIFCYFLSQNYNEFFRLTSVPEVPNTVVRTTRWLENCQWKYQGSGRKLSVYPWLQRITFGFTFQNALGLNVMIAIKLYNIFCMIVGLFCEVLILEHPVSLKNCR